MSMNGRSDQKSPSSEYVGVEYARRFLSDRYVPDDRVIEESVATVRRVLGSCRVYALGPTAAMYVGNERHVELVAVVPGGDTEDMRKRAILELVRLHIDADLEVITEAQFEAYADEPGSISYEVARRGRPMGRS